jgi:DNA-binding transcriptional LysR family regulator
MHYTLRQLQVFLAIAHFENVTKAAEHLAMSQSACSGALRDLETQFDVQLFDRVGKRLKTNELGRLIRPKAEALLSMADELEQDLKNQSHVGQIKVGATLTIGNYLAVPLVSRYLQIYGAEISLTVANTQTVVEQLLNFDIDIGMIEGEYQHAELHIIPWRTDELVCFCSPHHPLANRIQLTDEELISAQWILRESGSGTRQTFSRAMHGLIPHLNVLLELQHTEGIKRAVESGLGISCLSRITLQDAFNRGTLVPLQVPQRDFHRMLYAVLHKQKYCGTGLKRWLDLCEISVE